MTREVSVKSLSELNRVIKRDMVNKMSKVRAATEKAAKNGRNVIKRAVPVAFEELKDSVHDVGPTVVVDAPHAAAVNNGSRPHWVPLDALIKWVKLRGMQGLQNPKKLRGKGPTTVEHATRVASQLRALEVEGGSSYGRYLPSDAPIEIAKAIQLAIAKSGTKPHHFIESSLPEIRETLEAQITRAFKSDPE